MDGTYPLHPHHHREYPDAALQLGSVASGNSPGDSHP